MDLLRKNFTLTDEKVVNKTLFYNFMTIIGKIRFKKYISNNFKHMDYPTENFTRQVLKFN